MGFFKIFKKIVKTTKSTIKTIFSGSIVGIMTGITTELIGDVISKSLSSRIPIYSGLVGGVIGCIGGVSNQLSLSIRNKPLISENLIDILTKWAGFSSLGMVIGGIVMVDDITKIRGYEVKTFKYGSMVGALVGTFIYIMIQGRDDGKEPPKIELERPRWQSKWVLEWNINKGVFDDVYGFKYI